MIMLMKNYKPHHLHRNVDWIKAAHLYKLNECSIHAKVIINVKKKLSTVFWQDLPQKYVRKILQEN